MLVMAVMVSWLGRTLADGTRREGACRQDRQGQQRCSLSSEPMALATGDAGLRFPEIHPTLARSALFRGNSVPAP